MGVKNIAYINKEMLIWARNETPFATAEDVEAHSSSISAEKLSKWESGEDLPSVNEAKRLASIYKVPFACFYLSEVPEKKPKPYTDRRTALGTSYDVISYDLWSEIQRIVSNRECLIEFTEEDEIIPIPSIHDTSIEGIAKQIRDFLELKTPLKNKTAYGSNPFNYYRDILERKSIMVSQISGVSLKEMKGISMYYLETRRCVRSSRGRDRISLSRWQEAILPRRCEPFLQPRNQAVRVLRQSIRSQRIFGHR